MSMGHTGTGSRSSINVTPLIDVLLVLLIIFMVIQPTAVHGLPGFVAKPSSAAAASDQETFLLQVGTGSSGQTTFRLNTERLRTEDLHTRLHAIAERRKDAVLFVHGDADLDYGSVLSAIDGARQAGFGSTAIVTKGFSAGS